MNVRSPITDILLTAALALALALPVSARAGVEAAQLDGATLELRLDPAAFEGIGAGLLGEPRTLAHSRSGGTLTIDLDGDAFRKFRDGGTVFTGGPRLRAGGTTVDLSSFVVRSAPGDGTDLGVFDIDGAEWLRLRLGHHWVPGGAIFRSELMDVRPGPALVERVGGGNAAAAFLGTATLNGSLLTKSGAPPSPKLCAGTPNWPGDETTVDLRMIPQPSGRVVGEFETTLGRARGVVYLAPTARFRIVGTADVPWYSRFVTPEQDADCLDDGAGNCQPYSESAGGYLVWNVYRLRADGIVEQVGRSGVKHAFNSVNYDSTDPAFDCACRGSSRVAYAGCEDLYGAGTNADARFLGPRDELEAHPVAWDSCGSVFDPDCDGVCDNPRNTLWKCEPVVDDHTEFLPAVDAEVVATADRLHVESWYLVRDDVDVFNSMSTVEVEPIPSAGGPSGSWNFAERGFTLGPAITTLAETAGRDATVVETGAGRVLLDARTEDLGDGWTRYIYTVMNLDYDPQVGRVGVPLGFGTRIRDPAFIGAGGVSTTDWLTAIGPAEIAWLAPVGEALDWGTMMSFVFEADQPPVVGEVRFESLGEQGQLTTPAPRPGSSPDLLLRSGFEAFEAPR